MKRFLLKTCAFAAVLLAVTAAVFGFVYRFDDNGYFAHNPDYNPDNPTGKMALFRDDPCPNIIIGDSRVNELRGGAMEHLEELTGERWFNMGVGGASQLDINNQFRYCDSVTQLKRVVLTVSFVRMQVNDHADRVSIVREQMKNPLRYIYNIDTLKSAWKMMRKQRTPEDPPETGETPAEPPERKPPEDPVKAVKNIYDLCSYRGGYAVNTHLIDGLREIAATCERKGIELIVVALPYRWDSGVYVIGRLGLRDKIEGYKKEIASFATLYDMEFDSSFCDAENFRDNMHLSYAGRIRFIDALVSGKDEGLKIRGPGIAE